MIASKSCVTHLMLNLTCKLGGMPGEEDYLFIKKCLPAALSELQSEQDEEKLILLEKLISNNDGMNVNCRCYLYYYLHVCPTVMLCTSE